MLLDTVDGAYSSLVTRLGNVCDRAWSLYYCTVAALVLVLVDRGTLVTSTGLRGSFPANRTAHTVRAQRHERYELGWDLPKLRVVTSMDLRGSRQIVPNCFMSLRVCVHLYTGRFFRLLASSSQERNQNGAPMRDEFPSILSHESHLQLHEAQRCEYACESQRRWRQERRILINFTPRNFARKLFLVPAAIRRANYCCENIRRNVLWAAVTCVAFSSNKEVERPIPLKRFFSVQHLDQLLDSLMAARGRVHYGSLPPVVEGSTAAKRATTSSTAAIKWVGLAAVLMLSAGLVGSSLKTSSAVLGSENQQQLLRRESRAVKLQSSDVVVPVS